MITLYQLRVAGKFHGIYARKGDAEVQGMFFEFRDIDNTAIVIEEIIVSSINILIIDGQTHINLYPE